MSACNECIKDCSYFVAINTHIFLALDFPRDEDRTHDMWIF
jgi:hypothetical protein